MEQIKRGLRLFAEFFKIGCFTFGGISGLLIYNIGSGIWSEAGQVHDEMRA